MVITDGLPMDFSYFLIFGHRTSFFCFVFFSPLLYMFIYTFNNIYLTFTCVYLCVPFDPLLVSCSNITITTFTHIYKHTHIHTQTHTYHRQPPSSTYSYLGIYVFTYIYIYTYTYTFTYIHTHTLSHT